MTNYDGPFIAELIKRWDEMSEKRTKMISALNQYQFSGVECEQWEEKEPIRSFNPELNGIMMIINQYYCKEHPESTLTIEHLIQHNIAKEDKDYYFFRGDNNKKEDVRKYKEIWQTISRIKGEKKFQKKQEARPTSEKKNRKKE